jgi:hypothetical protein
MFVVPPDAILPDRDLWRSPPPAGHPQARPLAPTICARLGRTSAYMRAIGIAAEYLDEGPERTAPMKDAEEAEKALDVEKVEDFLDAMQST